MRQNTKPSKEDLMTEGDRRMQETVWRSKRTPSKTVLDKKDNFSFNFNTIDEDEVGDMADAIIKRCSSKKR